MSILVTGGTGTVGSHVVQELSKRGQLLGYAPRDFTTFASETARLWTSAQAGA